MNIDVKKIKQWFAGERLKLLVKAFFTVLAAWLAATVFASLSTYFLMSGGFFSGRAVGREQTAAVDMSKKLNYRDVRKSVLKRNIFNSAGEVPDQKELNEGAAQGNALAGQCGKPTLNLKVVGTIYLGAANSIVSVREANYSQSDTYRVADTIIGHDNVRVVGIDREQMILDNNGNRECYKIEKSAKVASRTPSYQSRPAGQKKKEGVTSSGGAVVLDSEWVEAQLGPGFSQVLKSARLVPNLKGESINGFKIFAIKKGTLFNKIGLRNGDIIQKVNDTSLEQAEQGFALYQTFQEDQEIVFNIIRKNKPQTISVMIK